MALSRVNKKALPNKVLSQSQVSHNILKINIDDNFNIHRGIFHNDGTLKVGSKLWEGIRGFQLFWNKNQEKHSEMYSKIHASSYRQ